MVLIWIRSEPSQSLILRILLHLANREIFTAISTRVSSPCLQLTGECAELAGRLLHGAVRLWVAIAHHHL